jgi:hypothetical protein
VFLRVFLKLNMDSTQRVADLGWRASPGRENWYDLQLEELEDDVPGSLQR